MTIEVGDVVTKLMLSSEFESEELTIPKQFPQQCFSGCLLLPKFPRPFHQTGNLIPTSVLSSGSYSLSLWERVRERA